MRTIVITGGSSGIGLAAAKVFARLGDDVVLVGRHPVRLERAVERVSEVAARPGAVRGYRADFEVLEEVRAVGERIASEVDAIDVLVNNAGMLAAWTHRTVDGYDATIQVNHFAGFLLAHVLRDKLIRSATPGSPARLITTGSLAEAFGLLDVDQPGAPRLAYRSRWLAYGASKQANLLFTAEAGRRWVDDGIVATCWFPGVVQTRFGRSSVLFTMARPLPGVIQPPSIAADTLVWLATADDALVPGGYFAFRAPFAATPRATDADRAARLWRASLTAVGLPG